MLLEYATQGSQQESEDRKLLPSGTLREREKDMAEREGFEPSVEFPLHTLSKRAPSTTRTSLRAFFPLGYRLQRSWA